MRKAKEKDEAKEGKSGEKLALFWRGRQLWFHFDISGIICMKTK